MDVMGWESRDYILLKNGEVGMQVLKRMGYRMAFKAEGVEGASIPKGHYVKAREKDWTCLAIVACPGCGTIQFIPSARNTVLANGELSKPLSCKPVIDEYERNRNPCRYNSPVQLLNYAREEKG